MSATFANPIIPGFHPDPSICRVGTDYYLVTSSFAYFPGIPLFRSRDLVHWHQLGHVLTRPEQLPLNGATRDFGFLGRCLNSLGIWAPTIRWHAGRFYVISTNMSHGGHFLVHADRAEGPWSDPVWIDAPGIDPSLFFDDDGRVYFSSNGWPHGATGLSLAEINLTSGRLLHDPKVVWPGSGAKSPEAPHLYKRKGYYYLLAAEGGTETGHLISLARAANPWGPYESCPHNPLLSHRSLDEPIQSTGHGDLVEAHDGSWWLVFLGTRPTGYPGSHVLGRETFLAPVAWRDGWPVVNEGRPVTPVMPAPGWPLLKPAALPSRDDFNRTKLETQWNFLRNPDPLASSLGERPGYLRLRCRAPALTERVLSPALVLRRQTAHKFRAEVSLEFNPGSEADEAGLTVYMNETHHASLGIVESQQGRRLRWRSQVHELAHDKFGPELPAGPVRLIITADGETYRLGLRSGSSVQMVGSITSRLLSTEIAGGFTGVFVGMFATGNGQDSDTSADFDWFDYNPE